MENPAFKMQYGLVENLLLPELHMVQEIAPYKEVEVRAVLVALTKVSGHGFSRAHVFSNALKVVNDISGKEVWSINSIIINIHCMLFFCLDLFLLYSEKFQ